MSKAPIKWLGTTRCDWCSVDLTKEDYFVDGATKGSSHWALMCPECYEYHGVGLGLGKGQKYSGKTLEKLEG